jgi:hypothetical protein
MCVFLLEKLTAAGMVVKKNPHGERASSAIC